MFRKHAPSLVVGTGWMMVALLTACGRAGSGSGGSKTQSVCDQYLSCFQSYATAAGQSAAYEQAKTAYGSSSACHSSSQAESLCEQSCQEGLDALKASGQTCASSDKSSGSTDGGASSGTTGTSSGPPASSGPSCVTTTSCESSDKDCAMGERCNTALDPPRCQTLYCGADGTACADDRGDAYSLCSTATCTAGVCGAASSSGTGTGTGKPGTTGTTGTTTIADCRGVVTCVDGCSDTACENTCESEASSLAENAFVTVVQCAESYCLGATNTPYKCALTSDGWTEIGGGALQYATDGTPASACAICLNDATAAIFGGTCVVPTSADCDLATGSAAQKACASELAACN